MAIRRDPEDFRVDEEPDAARVASLAASASADAPVAVCRLAKRSLSTPDAAAGLARALGIPPHAVRWGGLKDRHASTSQLVSVERPSASAARSLERGIEGRGWRARTVGWGAAHVDPTWIRANTFEIAVRDVGPEAVARMRERAVLLAEPGGSPCIVNYFGDQRFGSARHGEGFAARALLAGDVPAALRLLIGTPARKDHGPRRAFTRACARWWGDWPRLAEAAPDLPERKAIEALAAGASPAQAFMALPAFLRSMCVEAFQSLLWNDGARRLVRAAVADPIVADDRFGPLLFPRAADLPESWRRCAPPVPAPGMEFAEPWGVAWRAALDAECLAPGSLAVPALPEVTFGQAVRPLVVRADGLGIEAIDATGTCRAGAWLRFSLPRGAYATVVLRALGQ